MIDHFKIGNTDARIAVIRVICVLEGAKTHAKALHWASNNYSEHKLLDELLDVMSDYQDAIAEGIMGLCGAIEPSEFKPVSLSPNTSASDMVDMLCEVTVSLLNTIKQVKICSGISSETDAFLQKLTQYSYLLSLC